MTTRVFVQVMDEHQQTTHILEFDATTFDLDVMPSGDSATVKGRLIKHVQYTGDQAADE